MSKLKNYLDDTLKSITLPLLAFFLAILSGGLLIAFSDPKIYKLWKSPLEFLGTGFASAGHAYLALIQGSIFDGNLTSKNFLLGFYPLSETFVVAAPLILTGLSVTLAFRAGLFNIGAQGQFIFGAIGASYVGFHYNLPPIIHGLAAILGAIVLAGLWGGLVGFLKARTGAHEVIVTIMLNYISIYFLLWLLSTQTFLRKGRQDPIAPPVNETARLPKIFGMDYRINLGIFIALGVAYLIHILLTRTTWGFQFRSVGANTLAAKTAGMSVPFVMTSVMVICGGLAGLGGAVQVLGSEYALTAGVAGSFGFDAITVALLGRAKPLGTVLAALLFGALRAGGLTMQANTTTPIDIVLVIQALVVLFIAAPAMVRAIFRLKNVKSSSDMAAKGWNG
jgi:simple sugar transport system permease protein